MCCATAIQMQISQTLETKNQIKHTLLIHRYEYFIYIAFTDPFVLTFFLAKKTIKQEERNTHKGNNKEKERSGT